MTSAEKTSPNNSANDSTLANFIWKNADDLWGDFKHVEFGKIILPFTLLRRLECVLEPTKEAVIRESYAQEGRPDLVRERLLLRAAGQQFFNAIGQQPAISECRASACLHQAPRPDRKSVV